MRDCFSPEGGGNVAELVLDVLAFAGSSLWEVQLLYTVSSKVLCVPIIFPFV